MDENKQIEEMAKCCIYHKDGLCVIDSETSYCDLMCKMFGFITNLYNAGYRKQSEGEWVDEPHFAQRGLKGKYYVCSKCNVCVPTIEELPLYMWHYCPNCGAKMKGGAE